MILKRRSVGPGAIEVLQGTRDALVHEITHAEPNAGEFLLLQVHRRLEADYIQEAFALIEQAARIEEDRVRKLMLQAITPPPPPANALRMMEMARQARQFAIDSAEWLKASDIAEGSGRTVANPSTIPNRWKAEGRIFAINIDGADLFPAYGLRDAAGAKNMLLLEPKPVLARIIATLGEGFSGWQLAQWFASRNGYLGGSRPIDMLDTDPDLVQKAAELEVTGVQHG